MRTLVVLAVGLIFTAAAQAQVGSSISADGSAPNANAMLDVKSPATGAGKGMLIPRVTVNQRTNANASLAGGLLDGSGNLRGGAAQGLLVYQTDGAPGLYFNTSDGAVPIWVHYLPLTNGMMLGTLNMNGQTISNVAYIDFNTVGVSVGRGTAASDQGTAVGYLANGANGVAVGRQANGSGSGTAVGMLANGDNVGAAVGHTATGTNYGAAMGYLANGSSYGAAVGYLANGLNSGAALGAQANALTQGAAVGRGASGYSYGAALGYTANGSSAGAAVGYGAKGFVNGVALGQNAEGTNMGVSVGDGSKGSDSGVALGRQANGSSSGMALGYEAKGTGTNVAIGVQAIATGGVNRIAIGYQVTNTVNDSTRVRGSLYLDGGGSIYTNGGTFGSTNFGVKAFTIPHPLDPANKVLRHYCLEGPQVWNVYAGNAQLVNGQAVVELPDYYAALNLAGSEIYGLTVVGALAQVAVGAEVSDNCFTIIGDKDVKVSWTIKVLRNDPGCLEDLQRRPVEQPKDEIR